VDLPYVAEPVSLDRLAGDWQIYQLVSGHRFSADDMLTAWMAQRIAPGAARLLDLGAGLGSVGLMTLWALQDRAASATRTLTMVEAQEVSHRLALATIAHNALQDRVTARLGDMRTFDHAGGVFDLVTGSPPYFPVGTGKISPHPQKAACRMELRGTIADYALAATPLLGPDGWFVACFPARDPRGEAAFGPAGLHVRASCDVTFRAGGEAPVVLRLFAAQAQPGPRALWPGITIRARDGQWTPEYLELRAEMGSAMPAAG
jgi:tRNA1Val (adenine37-N6)-methyltransferase